MVAAVPDAAEPQPKHAPAQTDIGTVEVIHGHPTEPERLHLVKGIVDPLDFVEGRSRKLLNDHVGRDDALGIRNRMPDGIIHKLVVVGDQRCDWRAWDIRHSLHVMLQMRVQLLRFRVHCM